MNVNNPQSQISPWILFAREKMREAQEKMKQDGIEGDLAEQERVEEAKRAESWNRANASRSSLATTIAQASLGNPHSNDVLSFNVPGNVPPNLHLQLQATTATVHDMTAFVLEPDCPHVEMGSISLEMGQISSGTGLFHVEEPQGGVLVEIFVPQG